MKKKKNRRRRRIEEEEESKKKKKKKKKKEIKEESLREKQKLSSLQHMMKLHVQISLNMIPCVGTKIMQEET